MAKAEGKLFNWQEVSSIRTDYLETFLFDSPEQLIHIETEEFSAVCPFSGLPDIAKIIINYKPRGRKCVELKSLKYFFVSFRNVGIYQEAVTKRVYEDLKKILETDCIEVRTYYNTRGGMNVICKEGSVK